MEESNIYALIEINNQYNSLYFVNLINTSNTPVYKYLFCTNTLSMTLIRRINSATFWFFRKSTFWVQRKPNLQMISLQNMNPSMSFLNVLISHCHTNNRITKCKIEMHFPFIEKIQVSILFQYGN